MEPVEQVPGVTFHVQHAARTDVQGVVTLQCDVRDSDVWDKALEKLDNYRLYTVTQLHEAVTEVIKRAADQKEKELQQEVTRLRDANQRLQQQNTFLEASNREYIRANAAWARHQHHR